MNNKNEDVKNALDKIFGDDFIEIKETNSDDEKSLIDRANFTDYELEDDHKEINIQDTNKDDINNLENENSGIPDNDSNININDNKKRFNGINIKRILFTLSGLVLFLILLIIFYVLIFGINKYTKCEILAEDDGYKYTDKYEIISKKNKLINVKLHYEYIALEDEYNSQIEFIKKEKLPVIINSNGMSGFTYIYEVSDGSFILDGYLDFNKMKFDKIDKQDRILFPISYVDFDSKTTYNKFKKNLKKLGYICTDKKK